MMHMQFIATSLEDIADYFDQQSESASKRLDSKKLNRHQRSRLAGESDTWKEAAVFMREVRLDPTRE
jgi:hypothetical protein